LKLLYEESNFVAYYKWHFGFRSSTTACVRKLPVTLQFQLFVFLVTIRQEALLFSSFLGASWLLFFFLREGLTAAVYK